VRESIQNEKGRSVASGRYSLTAEGMKLARMVKAGAK
jgi:hypothetical protein